MSTINQWSGNAPAVNHEATISVNDAVVGALYKVTLQGKTSVETRGIDGDTTASIASRLADLLDAVDGVDIEHVAGESEFRIIGETAGVPIAQNIIGSSPASSFTERIVAGKLAVEHDYLLALPDTTTGGTFKVSVDFVGDGSWEETVSQAHNETPANLESDLDALASASADDFMVSLESSSPRTYRIKVGGTWAGKSVAIKADTTLLEGNASVEIDTVQTTGANAQELQAVWISNVGQNTTVRFSIDGGENFGEWSTKAINSVSSDASVLTEIQSRLDAILGSGFVTAQVFANSITSGLDPSYVLITLKYAGRDSHEIITVEAKDNSQFPVVSSETLQVGGGANGNDFQVVNAVNPTIGGTGYTLSLDGEASSPVGVTSNNASLILALEASANIGVGDAQIHRPGHFACGLYIVELQNNLANTNQSLMTAGDSGGNPAIVEVTGLLDGVPPVNEIQRIIIRADEGTLTYSHDGNGPTVATNHDEVAATVQSRFEGLASIGVGGVSVSGSATPANPMLAEFIGANAETNMALIEYDASNLTGGKSATITQDVAPVPGVNEVQAVNIDENATGGTYYLKSQGQPTNDLAYNATVATAESEFESVSTIGVGNVSFDGTPQRLLIEYVNGLAAQPVELVEINQDELVVSGDSALSVSVDQLASSPNHWNGPLNWSLEHVPNSGEVVLLKGDTSSIEYGLVQSAECSFSGTDITLSQPGDFIDGQIVRLKTSDTLPTAQDSGGAVALSVSTDYYIVSTSIDSSGNQVLKIAEADNGEPIEFTNSGTGTHRIGVRLEAFRQFSTYSGPIGHPQFVDGDWYEGQRYLQIDLEDPVDNDPNVELGIGEGSGLGSAYIDFGTSHVDVRILNSQGGGDEPAINIDNDNISESEIVVVGGSVGIGNDPSSTPRMKKLLGFGGRTLIGNADLSRVESYNQSVESTSTTASGNIVQVRA